MIDNRDWESIKFFFTGKNKTYNSKLNYPCFLFKLNIFLLSLYFLKDIYLLFILFFLYLKWYFRKKFFSDFKWFLWHLANWRFLIYVILFDFLFLFIYLYLFIYRYWRFVYKKIRWFILAIYIKLKLVWLYFKFERIVLCYGVRDRISVWFKWR